MRSISRISTLIVFGMTILNCRMSGQLLQEFHPRKTQCCSAVYAQRLADDLQDWAMLGRYFEDNQRLAAIPRQPGRVVFLGDSITDFWDLVKSFPEKPYINRGISGQTTAQILVRMYPDVIKLQPDVVIILAGTNDIAGNTGSVTLAMIQDNFRAITELAEKHGIKVVLCTLTPVSDYTANPQTVRHPADDIRKLNEWIRRYARQEGAGLADFYSAVVDEQGFLRKGLSNDGLHPNESGYALLVPVAAGAIEKAIR
ncbi:MAG: SGNH/GDSL hydrolase family protein [Acidobacteriia bacterium]|nr:SGNH/GDSL hydrolase family protein [Terriglobia bacterium]